MTLSNQWKPSSAVSKAEVEEDVRFLGLLEARL